MLLKRAKQIGESLDDLDHHGFPSISNEFLTASQDVPFLARVVDVKQLIKANLELDSKLLYKDTYLVTLEVPGWTPTPGQAIGFCPENDPLYINQAARMFGIEYGHSLVRLNLMGPPLRPFLKRLSVCIPNNPILSMDPQIFLDQKVAILDLLCSLNEDEIFSIKQTFSLPSQFLDKIQPRYYSISNSPLVSSANHIQFVFNVPRWHVIDSDPSTPLVTRSGVASSWLQRLLIKHSQSSNIIIPVFPRKIESSFKVPEEPCPIVMICAGTGVAPFIGFLQHRKALGIKAPAWLFYGIRSTEHDFLFEKELLECLSHGILTKLFLATSRQIDQISKNNGQLLVKGNSHVQDTIDTRWLYELMTNDNELSTKIFICGDELSMVKDINALLLKMVMDYADLDRDRASKRLLEWSAQRRIVRDIWT